MIARAGQTIAARIAWSAWSPGTTDRYASRWSLRSEKIPGASCSQKPKEPHRPASTATVISSARRRLDTVSSSARGSRATGASVSAPAAATVAQASTTAVRTGAAATSAPDTSRCAATSVKAR